MNLIKLYVNSNVYNEILYAPNIKINGKVKKSAAQQKLILDLLNQFNIIIEKNKEENINVMYPPVLEDISKKKKLIQNLLIDLKQIKILAENNFEIEINEYKDKLKNKSITKIIKK